MKYELIKKEPGKLTYRVIPSLWDYLKAVIASLKKSKYIEESNLLFSGQNHHTQSFQIHPFVSTCRNLWNKSF